MKKVFFLSILSMALFSCSETDILDSDSDINSDSQKSKAGFNEAIVPLDSLKFPKAPPVLSHAVPP